MKLIPTLSLWGCSVALIKAQAPTCPLNEISCTIPSNTPTNACCAPTYGLVVFAQQWLPKQGPRNAFTIHGLWPNSCNGSYAPSNGCDPSRNYSNVGKLVQQQNATLYQQMNTYWVSYNGDNGAFWTHEWDKHGTCVTTLAPQCFGKNYRKYQEMMDYFGTVLELRQQYDVYSALSSAGILPGKSYPRQAMIQAVRKSLNIDPWFHCKNGVLDEVWLYFNVKGRNQYIPAQKYSGSTQCPTTIEYPPK
ncbi:ribonuclease T2 [Basidiobolus meristosporus CBS 931.73]|uniref:ribonuclease T2 n=1 Tax=Basidiobolus meristosporus CBS 931.73 TaxID=1314790 RepID=A0A1Y1XI80_9FUNG|nr:ribonuclease T2 [Basidiobolus meristosporus CBS 931.73]|eukprot:ORX85443.1 ribonuclease T2 [Basidiobolus meristosporus CBS 931.73]